ncbi:MAG: hypothetical protein LBS18_07660 [Clostridiales bacterium]|jgi:alanyl-tRNA synthetase|nr:hypothetical protein [Clostridiales bacterium]
MTSQLYLNNSYLKTAKATVLRCAEITAATGQNAFYDVVLDKTIFYPAGGGQPHDLGTADEVEVLGVTEHGGEVTHRMSGPLPAGKRVALALDWPRRFDHMQQHSGEHLLSFAAKDLFDAVNVGFHMAPAYCTVDFDRPFTESELDGLERRANELIWANLPVIITYVDETALEGLTLRKKAGGLTGTVRVISMPGGDSCTCCGTHVRNTGEVGALKLTAAENYKGGARVTFACGARAQNAAARNQRIVQELARRFSCRGEDVTAAVSKQGRELSDAKHANKILTQKIIAYMTRELLNDAAQCGKIKLVTAMADIDAAQLRPLALSLCKTPQVFALLLGRSGENMQYVICRSEDVSIDAGEISLAVNAALNAHGGGRGALAQGNAKYTPAAKDALEQLRAYLTQVVKYGG